VLSTGLLSFLQERNAGKVVEKLQSMISLKTCVLRDGIEREIPGTQVLQGDVLVLRAGDIVPADCLLLTSDELYANEAGLTGESFPVRKACGVVDAEIPLHKRSNCLWEGTNLVSGDARALVIQTGEDTIFGKISGSASGQIETPFEKGIKDFGFFLMKITLTLAVFILVINLLHHKGVIESALFALALAVGMAPELLPAITTISMSAGAKKMLEKKVIVKKLNSIQNLGEVNLLCTDKTGTITEGSIAVNGTVDVQGNHSEWVNDLAYWNAVYESGYSNPIDASLKKLKPFSKQQVEKLGEVPYDFIRKRLSIGIAAEEGNVLISKGAFSQIASICTEIRTGQNTTESFAPHLEALEQKFVAYGKSGLRVIAICYKSIQTLTISKDLESEMVFAGFILLSDPVKQEIQNTIQSLRALGVGLKIITGDNPHIALSIATKIGIQNPRVLTGKELVAHSPEALKQLVKHTHVFAEVEPQQKEQIILALKNTYTVAYMGDGINDVSAIHAADVGISVDNAVDIARESADFVLMEKDLRVLVDGIIEGRKTFANTMKYLFISTGSTFGNMCSVAAASLILPFLPMLPKQILLTNFLTDFPFLMVSTDNVDKEQYEKPGKWNLKLIRSYMVIFGIHSSFFDLLTFVTLYFVWKAKSSVFQTGWFVESVLSELLIVFIIRTRKSFVNSQPGRYLLFLSVGALVSTLLLPYLPFAANIGLSPLPVPLLMALFGILIMYVITADLLKIWFFKKHTRG
jgi:Mg2+-importing ATPase